MEELMRFKPEYELHGSGKHKNGVLAVRIGRSFRLFSLKK